MTNPCDCLECAFTIDSTLAHRQIEMIPALNFYTPAPLPEPLNLLDIPGLGFGVGFPIDSSLAARGHDMIPAYNFYTPPGIGEEPPTPSESEEPVLQGVLLY